MTRHDDAVSMRHMLDFSREIVEILEGRERSEVVNDRLVVLAVSRLFEMLGEAANRVSDETRALHREIPWGYAIGMRNRLIHGYDVVDLDIVWDTAHENLPELIEQLEGILGKRSDS
jgi:uncharacterized protein with HEPN domain